MAVGARRAPLETLAAAATRAADETELHAALETLAAAAAEATDADLAVVRLVDAADDLVARAVAPGGAALAAEVAGSRSRLGEAAGEVAEPTRRAAERARATSFLAAPIHGGLRLLGSLELVWIGSEHGETEQGAADFAATQIALALRAFGADVEAPGGRRQRLELAGRALAAGDGAGVWAGVVRVAIEASGARGGMLWRGSGDELAPAAAEGVSAATVEAARELVRDPAPAWEPAATVADPRLGGVVVTLPVGEPPFAALQLVYPDESAPDADDLPALSAFAARAAHALRGADRAAELAADLERARAFADVVSDAVSRLSLAHTLETAVERIAELFSMDAVGVYLRDGSQARAAAGRGLGVGHDAVARSLLDAVLGPLRARTSIATHTGDDDPTLARVRAALSRTGRSAAIAVPLHVGEETIGLLVAYPARPLSDGDASLLASLGAQVAVAVQNARLHEEATRLGDALGSALASERQAARRVRALYEISRSFAQTLSLDSTVAAVTKTIVEVLGVEAAVIRLPDERGDVLVPHAVYVADSRLEAAVRAILEQSQPRPRRTATPAMLDAARARQLGGAHALLVPFLEKGSTAALLPIATATELLAQLTILSLDPAEPIDDETLDTAGTIARQAVLAIDNARLYQQQKAFAETMQRSLLPRERPAVAGLEIGTVYESAAQVDVGGDVFDFLELADGRLAVVLGDVTGHGIDATADMAMAKFVFRSLAREHSEPSEFLAHANEVVVGEIAVGKFITMAYLLVDAHGEVLSASAGHPAPRLVRADGTVEALGCSGLALGIEPDQRYEQVRGELEEGAAVVLYTDGVIEARRDRELFGEERLDEVLSAGRDLPAQELADIVLAACRGFSGGDLADDCAIVVLRRTATA